MTTITFLTATTSEGVVDRGFTLPSATGDDVTGVLWTPAGVDRAPLVLTGHGGGLHKRQPALVARALHLVTAYGFAVAAIDAPGHGDRPRSDDDQAQVAAMFRAREAGESITPIVAAYNHSLAERNVPEWRATLDGLTELPDIDPDAPVGYTGMTLGSTIGLHLVAAEPRIGAAVFGGVLAWPALLDAARRIEAPVQFILPWDDVEIPREDGFALFDAFASHEKVLHANPGGHHEVPLFEAEDAARFLARHLLPVRA